ILCLFFFSSRRRHTRFSRDWSSDVCSSDLAQATRVVSVALTAARGLGFTRVACASTGNLANSVAAHAARAGLPSVVFIPADLEPGKVVTTAVYGGDLVAVEGSYDDVNRLCSELVETDEFEDT